MSEPSGAVVLLSGGLDSTTLLYELKARGLLVVGLGFDYGQRHRRELECASRICYESLVHFEVADLSGIKHMLSASVLTGGGEVPHGHYAEESMKATVVPNRNMIMLAIAAGFAASENILAVATAVHAGDHFIYPDCRPEFVDAMRTALHRGMKGLWNVQLLTPFLMMTKAGIVRRGAELGVPFHLTWSCYEGGDIHCGQCGTCVERREAFTLAGVADPTTYAY